MASQLVSLRDFERLSARVIRVLGGNPGQFTLQGTNTYIIGTGEKRLLVDTGEGKTEWIARLKGILQQENAVITDAIMTHWHHDHVGGIKHLLEFSPNTNIYKNKPSAGQHDICDEQTFKVEGASLKAVFSPGHTQDHMAFVLEEENAMFTGDNVLGNGTTIFEDLRTYLNSLEKMRGQFQGRAYPGHGPVIEDGPKRILEYIQHRQQREDQVIRVLKSARSAPGIVGTVEVEPEHWTPMDIVKIIYQHVPEDLHRAAYVVVMQILRRLQEEGHVEEVELGKWKWKIRHGIAAL